MSHSLALRPHRCFRTTIDGRIPLVGDWRALFAAIGLLDEVSLLTRHPAARLVHLGQPPRLAWQATCTSAISTGGPLTLHLTAWARAAAWGRLVVCDCCGSPGRVELHRPDGSEVLQLSAATDCSLGDWSNCLASLVGDFPTHEALVTPPPTPLALPQLDDDAHLLALSGKPLAPLLAALGERGAPFSCMLRTPETTHTRTFVPKRTWSDDEVLTATDSHTTLQLALPCVASLALTRENGAAYLHALASNDALLATFHAAPSTKGAAVWEAAVTATFAASL